MTIPNPGDRVRPYDVHRAFRPGLPGQVATYKKYCYHYGDFMHLVTDSDGQDRFYDRVEIDAMTTNTEPKVGDRVKVFGHINNRYADGTEGTYAWKDAYGSHPYVVKMSDGSTRQFREIKAVAAPFKNGDQVKVYGYYNQDLVPDGTVGTFRDDKHKDGMGNSIWADVPFEGDDTMIVPRAFPRVELVKSEQTVDEYKQFALKILDAKRDEHDWCGEYDEVIEELGIERPSVLPQGKYAIVETQSGNKYVRVSPTQWRYISERGTDLFPESTVSRDHKRTLFEGEK